MYVSKYARSLSIKRNKPLSEIVEESKLRKGCIFEASFGDQDGWKNFGLELHVAYDGTKKGVALYTRMPDIRGLMNDTNASDVDSLKGKLICVHTYRGKTIGLSARSEE